VTIAGVEPRAARSASQGSLQGVVVAASAVTVTGAIE